MGSLRGAVLLLAILCCANALADDGVLPPRKVTPPGDVSGAPEATAGGVSKRGGSWTSTLFSVGLCLAGVAWVFRCHLRVNSSLDGELWKVISQRPLDARHRLMVVRFADSLLLLSVSQNQVTLLKEIDDPDQVAEVKFRVAEQRQDPSHCLKDRLSAFGFLRGMA